MSQKSLAIIFIRILGIYCVIKCLGHIGGILGSILPNIKQLELSDLYPMLAAMVPLIVFLTAMAIILFKFAGNFAGWMCTDQDEMTARSSISEDSLYLLACSIIGILVLVWKVAPELSNTIFNVINSKQADMATYADQSIRNAWYSGFRLMMYLVIAVFLIFKGQGILGFIRKFRDA